MPQDVLARLAPARPLWPAVAMIVGGLVWGSLWPIYTSLHGPTSFDEDGELLGLGTLFWGSMMEGPSGVLIALGLAGSYGRLTRSGGRKARVGFWLALVATAVPALVNLAILALMPPLLTPVLGIGLILIAVGNRGGHELPRAARTVLLGLGLANLCTFAWSAAVRPDMIDRIDGYRIQGLVANVAVGLGWILLGAILLSARRAPAAAPATVTSTQH